MTTVADREQPTETPEPVAVDEQPPRRALGYLLLALLAYVPPLLTAPGKIAADTKQYLYLDPGRLMERAPSMWDPNVGMGTVTHQTIGYVFPMGPYYWLMSGLGVPDWVAQRLWLGSLLFSAAVGVLFLLRTFGLRGPGVVVAALAYMLTPYVLDYAARISVLLMPYAALPWLIAIIYKALHNTGPDVSRRGRFDRRRLWRWRYPAIFALIVQIIGGVNATALLFVGLAPVLYILWAWLIARDVDFRRVFGVTVRTGVLTVLTSLWWIAGLRMQAAYGLDILKYTETIDAVARTSAPNEVLRGLGYWFFYGQDRLGPWIEASPDYTQHLWVILAGYTLAALGLLSGALLRWRQRTFFIGLMLVGVVIAVGVFPYDHPTPLGALFKAAANGSTAGLAMRSTGRAVPLVVLSLALFVGLATNVVSNRLRGKGKVVFAVAVPAVVIALLIANFPALYDGSYYGKNLQRPSEIPDYWTQAISALSARGNQTRMLEVPGADFASYRWGNTVDPITPGLTDRPYVARELIPYGTAGSADLLNAMDRRLQEGVTDPDGLAPLFRRMGIGDVVARNDIEYERYDLISPREMRRVLDSTPGLDGPTTYGPPADYGVPGYQDEITLAAPPNEAPTAPVVVYPVSSPQGILHAESSANGVLLSGDGEGLVDAADVGLLNGTGAVQYSASYPAPDALRAQVRPDSILVVTDNNRLRARRWTSVRDNLGYTEQAGEADKPLKLDTGDARLPLFPGQSASALTTTVDEGVKRAQATAYGNTITYTPEDRAARALDGDPFTAWRGNAFGDARGQKIRIDLATPITTDHVNLVQPLTGGRARYITNIEMTFDGKDPVYASLDASSRNGVGGQTLSFPRRTFSTFEVTVKQTNSERTNLFGQEDAVGFAEIRLRDEHADHDVSLHEIEQMPTDMVDALGSTTGDHPFVLVMHRDAVRPVPPRSQPENSIDRAFTVPTGRTFTLTGNATLSTEAPPELLQAALGIPDAAHGGVSSRDSQLLSGCMQCRADNAIDENPLTAWETPFIAVRNQFVQYTSSQDLSFDHMDLRVLADGRHSVPTLITLAVDGKREQLRVPPIADQPSENASSVVRLTFPRVTGRTVKVTIDDVREERAKRFATDDTTLMPVGIAELGIPGLAQPAGSPQVDSGCRNDLLAIDGKPVPVRITGLTAGAAQVMGLTVSTCGSSLALTPGRHVLTTARGKDVAWSLDRLVLASGTATQRVTTRDGRITAIGAPASNVPQIQVLRTGRTSARVRVTGASFPFWMVLGQSHSPGWHANVVGGKGLGPSQLVDGYANGWLVTPPAVNASGAFDIEMQWTPQREVWAAIWISVLAALACLAIIVLTWKQRVRVVGAGDATVSLDTSAPARSTGWRARWLAPLLAGGLAAIAVAPWVGIVIALAIALIAWAPKVRTLVLIVPAALLLGCGVYIAIQQYRFDFPSVFEWPTLFPRVRWLAWIAVMLLAGDAILDVIRNRGGPDADADH